MVPAELMEQVLVVIHIAEEREEVVQQLQEVAMGAQARSAEMEERALPAQQLPAHSLQVVVGVQPQPLGQSLVVKEEMERR
jgi:hypothetical protein